MLPVATEGSLSQAYELRRSLGESRSEALTKIAREAGMNISAVKRRLREAEPVST